MHRKYSQSFASADDSHPLNGVFQTLKLEHWNFWQKIHHPISHNFNFGRYSTKKLV